MFISFREEESTDYTDFHRLKVKAKTKEGFEPFLLGRFFNL
jgi:hypothetical protein